MRVFRSVPRRLRVVSILFIPAAGLTVASPAVARADITATGVAPVITSAGFVQVELREPVNFTVTATGTPTPALTEHGQLPAGITFTDHGNGTATLGGEVTDPAVAPPPPLNSYFLILEANNGVGTLPDFQLFEINVGSAPSAPSFASADSVTEAAGAPFSFTVNTYGYPAPALTEKGHLPRDITFTDNGDGTATIAIASDGRDYQDGGHNEKSYRLDITATSSAGTATQEFTLNITTTRRQRR
jgi:hypothetical protein